MKRFSLVLLSLSLSLGLISIAEAAEVGRSCKSIGSVQGELICLKKGSKATWQRLETMKGVRAAISFSIAQRALPKDIKPALKDVRADKSDWLDQECAVDFPDVLVPDCRAGDPQGKKVMVVYGDSHASMWMTALDVIAKRHGYRIYLFAKLACPLVEETIWSYQLNRPFQECSDWQKLVLPKIQSLEPDLLIVTDQFKPAVIDGKKSDFDTPFLWQREFPISLKRLASYSKRLVVLGNNPSMQQDSVACASKPRVNIALCSSSRTQAGNVQINRIEEESAKKIGATFIDTVDLACDDYLCPVFVGDKFVYFDQWHFTETYVKWLTPVIERLLKP